MQKINLVAQNGWWFLKALKKAALFGEAFETFMQPSAFLPVHQSGCC